MVFAPVAEQERADYSEIYNNHCHRIYSLAFYLTDNELAAEQVATNTFLRAFSTSASPRIEHIDNAFLAEAREFTNIGVLTLNKTASAEPTNIRGNIKRVYLERAVVQLPATEKLAFLLHDVESYEHARIGRLLGITEDESMLAVHQARMRIRELVSEMV